MMILRELTWQRLVPELVFDSEAVQLRVGESLNLSLSVQRHCVGYKQFGDNNIIACPGNSEIPPGKETQCVFCRQKDVSFTAKTGYGLSEQAGMLLSSDHAVYLAYFSDSIIKVGVTLWDRREIRVSEQGALACLFIAKGNGTMARNFEQSVHRHAGFTEWVRLESKLKALCRREPDENDARRSLMEAYAKVKITNPSSMLLSDPQLIYLFSRYKVHNSVFALDVKLITEIAGGSIINARLQGVYGKVLLLEAGGLIYALNSQLLAGFELTTPSPDDTEKITCINTKCITIDRQQGLLDMF